MLIDKAKHAVEIPLKFSEGEKFGELIQVIVALQRREAVGRMACLLQLHVHIVAYRRIGEHCRGREWGGEYKPFE